MGVTYSQLFPPKPTLTEANLPSQKGKVFIVTGGTAGIGFELCTLLYQAGGKVYLGGRSKENAQNAITRIKALPTDSPGDIIFLQLSLDDLTTIGPAVETFKASESRLDVLFNNAGVSSPPSNLASAQGHELTVATNCLGPHLLTQLLLPTLVQTAKSTSAAAVRVIWLASMMVDLAAAKGGLPPKYLETVTKNPTTHYTTSKVGNWFLASALANQAGPEGVLSVAVNPGNLKTEILRHTPSFVEIIFSPLLYKARMGAYTELWAGLSPELGMADGGNYILPWGRVHPSPRPDLVAALRTKEEGGTGEAAVFVEFCDKKIAEYR